MERHLTTHDLTWFLEADRNRQLNLDPPYQRRSVWTRKEKQFFLDTIFRNYPCPAIFLHKTLDENGRPTYHVVDGKQRIQAFLEFASGQLRMAENYGDARLNSKHWLDLKGETELRNRFWNYKFVVEEMSFDDPSIVNEIFDRINRNTRKLMRQELRHAKFEGWFISHAEREADQPEWRTLGIVTQAREKRMADSQFLSELMLVALEGKLHGFDQDNLDRAYGNYDDISTAESTINEDQFLETFSQAKNYLLALEHSGHLVTRHCRALNNFYSLWALLVLEPRFPAMPDFNARYDSFMSLVGNQSPVAHPEEKVVAAAAQYSENLRGANTDLGPREARHEALVIGLQHVL